MVEITRLNKATISKTMVLGCERLLEPLVEFRVLFHVRFVRRQNVDVVQVVACSVTPAVLDPPFGLQLLRIRCS